MSVVGWMIAAWMLGLSTGWGAYGAWQKHKHIKKDTTHEQ